MSNKSNPQDGPLVYTKADLRRVNLDLEHATAERDAWTNRASASKRAYDSHMTQEAKANLEVERHEEILRKVLANLEKI